MERVTLKGGVSLSRLVYGTWRLAEDDTSPARIRAKLAACLEQGITTIDHADIYGGYQVEEIFGSALKGSGLADNVEIVTKCGIIYPTGRYSAKRGKHYDTTSGHIRHSVDTSLRLLGIDKIDLLLIHRPDPMMDFADTAAGLDAVVASGKVRAVGVSNFRPWDVEALQAAMATPLAVNQIEISLQALAPFTQGDLAHMQKTAMRPMAWSPLGGGALVKESSDLGNILDKIAVREGVDRASVAVAWLLAHPAGIMPVLGTNNLARIGAISATLKVKLSREDWFVLYSAALGTEVP